MSVEAGARDELRAAIRKELKDLLCESLETLTDLVRGEKWDEALALLGDTATIISWIQEWKV